MSYNTARSQLTDIKYELGENTLFDVTYDYSNASGQNNGQIVGITDNHKPGRSVVYEYDKLGRLKNAETTGAPAYPKWELTWGYDRFGNREKQMEVVNEQEDPNSPLSSQFTYDQLTNRIDTTQHPGFAYDNSGNMTADGTYTMTYDPRGRMISAVDPVVPMTANYTYDGKGLRVKKVITGGATTRYIYSGANVIAEYVDGSSTPDREYVYAGGRLVAMHDDSEVSPHYYHADQLSIRLTTDKDGTVEEEQGHYPFGESWYGGTSNWQFTTYERDDESGLDYAIARYHGSGAGRFNTPDPIPGWVTNPQSLNRYAYVINDPVNGVDPLGLRVVHPWVESVESFVADDISWDISLDALTPDNLVIVDRVCVSTDDGHGGSIIHCTNYATRFVPPDEGRFNSGRGGGAATSGGASATQSPCSEPRYADAIAFMKRHQSDARKVATAMNTTVANVLGHAGYEAGWKEQTSHTTVANNYFGLTVGPEFKGTTGQHQVGNLTFGVYPDPGFLNSGLSLAGSSFGQRAGGTKDASSYAQAIGPTFDPTNPNYVNNLEAVIRTAEKLLPCLGSSGGP